MSTSTEKNNIRTDATSTMYSCMHRTYIDKFAANDIHTRDEEYNKGLEAIRQYGYHAACVFPEVKYYVECNNLHGV